MPLQKIQLKPGVNREVTRYAAEGTWYETDKVRFLSGMPQKIGGWERISANTYLGVCRSMKNWVTLVGQNLVAVGTEIKYYLERGGAYLDITPLRLTTGAGDVTFSATNGDATLTATDTGHGVEVGDYISFTGAVSLGGVITAAVINQEYQVATVTNPNVYTIEAKDTDGDTVTANASDSGNGGGSVIGYYQIHQGNQIDLPTLGWSAGAWGGGTWGVGDTTSVPMRLWSQSNFGEDLIFAYRGGSLFLWDATNGTEARGVYLTVGGTDVPTIVNYTLVSDISRFVFAFGCNPTGSAVLDPMLIRWSDQEDASDWGPLATNQAGSLRLSSGTEIITALQSRQEILVWSDSAVYNLQYLGAPEVWGGQLVGDNITIASQNAVIYANNTAYWMGKDKFYVYDGTVQTLPCSVKSYVFDDFNFEQTDQVVTGTNERFDEIWWFYCSSSSTQADRYVVYNYVDNIWFYGSMLRSAWMDSDLREYPLAATYSNNLTNHEIGQDDRETSTPTAITATLVSAEFDLDEGDKFMFVSRILPDVSFIGSSADSPAVSMTLSPMQNSGSGYNSPLSEGGNSSATVTRSATVPIEQFTGQAYIRLRGRQMAFKVESDALGVAWKLGYPRLDMRPDGRR